jgi:hypothetical protein
LKENGMTTKKDEFRDEPAGDPAPNGDLNAVEEPTRMAAPEEPTKPLEYVVAKTDLFAGGVRAHVAGDRFVPAVNVDRNGWKNDVQPR